MSRPKSSQPGRLQNLKRYLASNKVPLQALSRAMRRDDSMVRHLIERGAPSVQTIRDLELVLTRSGLTPQPDIWIDTNGHNWNAPDRELRTLTGAVIDHTARAIAPAAISINEEPIMEALTVNARQHFNLTRDPFRNDVRQDADVFETKEYALTVKAMIDAAQNQDFIAVIADVGAGKTVCLQRFAQQLPQNIRAIFPQFPDKGRIKPGGVLDAILYDLGGDKIRVPRTNEAKARAVRNILEALEADNQYAVLVVDEAHAYDPRPSAALSGFTNSIAALRD